ncbi:sensor histidine kinase [Flagellimonas amoyensis]|uniref:sensor histidine kinase n=1 Tax=Flagellimonas amoyensis TaxID=2169401 RepID=UPI00131EE3EF|nr:HAMP domain-containing sensor histidine kinase [Allomuricauda amoyensis]
MSLLFFVVAGFIIVFDFDNIIGQETDKYLINREEIATTQLVNDVNLESLNNYEQSIKKTDFNGNLDQLKFKDTLRYDIIDDAFHAYRMLYVTRRIGNQYYEIRVFRSLIQPNILIKEVLISLFIVFLGLLAFLILSNLLISARVWRPFKETLTALEGYELGSNQPVDLHGSTTQEFNQLNKIILGMIEKIRFDYLNLKEFTENVAHEIQTPLSIIRRRSEKLLQSDGLIKEEIVELTSIYNNCIRLSKVNRGLTLLTKIGSGAYKKEKQVSITDILRSQVQHFDEMISLRNISLSTDLSHEIRSDINPELGLILISNIIRNAINHNYDGGSIHIATFDQGIAFENTGSNEPVDNDLFKRFKKTDGNTLGLGLALITKICGIYDIEITYGFIGGKHRFKLHF